MKIFNAEVECTAAEVGYDATRLDAVNRFFTRMIEDKIIFGVSYRLARRGKVFAAASIGSRHYNNPDIQMMPNTPFGLASQTKQFAAVGILMMAEDGLVSIDDAAAKYLPQFDGAPYNEITLMHLLTHTSGLHAHAGLIPDKYQVDTYEQIRLQYEKDGKEIDWIATGIKQGLRYKTGTEWQYCSFGLEIIAAIIEKVSGIPYRTFVQEKICKPLGMTNTTYDLSPEMADNAVVFNNWSEKDFEEAKNTVKKEEVWDLLPSAGSGMYSTTEDMIRFGIMLQQNGRLGDTRILGRKAIELLSTQRLFNVPDNCWGSTEKDRKYGLCVDMRRFPNAFYSTGTFLHEGSGHSVTIVDPKEEMVCSCVYPWVNDAWNADCNGRLYNVMWSGLL